MKHTLTSALFIVILLILWQLGSMHELWSPYLFPSPGAVAIYLWDNVADGTLPAAAWVTLRRLFIGYSIGILLGIPLGILCAHFKSLAGTLGVTALGLQGLPSVCWVPMATLWFGQTESAMLFVVIMGTVWSVILSTENGMHHVPPLYARAAFTMGYSKSETLLLVVLPASAPFVVSGMKQGWAFAWRSLMSAEIFVPILSGFGLGQLLHFGRELNAMDQVLAIMAVILLIGILSDKLLFSPLEQALHRRWGTSKP